MKFNLIAVILAFATTFSFGQSEVNVKLSGMLFNSSSKEVRLSQQIDNSNYQDYATAKMDADGNFSFTAKLPAEDYYILRLDEGVVFLILRNDSDIKVYGDAKKLGTVLNVVGSDESAVLNSFSHDALSWVSSRNDAAKRKAEFPASASLIDKEMEISFEQFKGRFQQFYSANLNSPAIIAALNVIDPNNDYDTFEAIIKSLNVTFGKSNRVKELYQLYTQIKKQKDDANILAPGKPAPDFEELMADRTTKMKLSDLKGKVVLLDFWASWCGPCRKENPNVVNVYNKYKDKGFTVMNVSLDDNLDRWKQAIIDDGLVWPNHVSDLRKWNSQAAQLYGVRGIPFTVLIDQNGNIVQTNLRGAALEEAVSTLLK